jgi:hypothetical protein
LKEKKHLRIKEPLVSVVSKNLKEPEGFIKETVSSMKEPEKNRQFSGWFFELFS